MPQDHRIADFDKVNEIYNGIDYLQCVSKYERPIENSKVIVVGGGNTAIDCARTAVRFNNDVTILYRRTREEMPAEDYEIKDAEDEGIKFIFLAAPYKVCESNGKLTGIECYQMRLGFPDATGRRSPEVVNGANFIIDCDYIISAIGQKPDMSFITENDNLKITRWNTIISDDTYFTTSIKGIFAAGDCIDGENTVVRAIGNGKRAAQMMDRYMLTGKPYLTPSEVMEKYLYDNKIFSYGETPEPPKPVVDRYNTDKIPLEERMTTFNEVEKPFDENTVALEARRCLRCKRVGMFATGAR